ncbi:hypothetical protein AB0H69_45660 [Streptomyces phaeochromogenes]|uniref:hypothetical protein n=1 Tax=Streptomyces phaeochromogenes TaxID=1923 RepID=UPI0033D1D87E
MTSQPHHAPSYLVARLVAEHAAGRMRTVDDHMFCGSEQCPAPGAFRLHLFTSVGVRPVVCDHGVRDHRSQGESV